MVLNPVGIAEFKDILMQDRIEYVADMRSMYEDLVPKDTGALARSAEQVDSLESSKLVIQESYGFYVEFGTRPFRMKLIPIELGPSIQADIRKKGGRVVKQTESFSTQFYVEGERHGRKSFVRETGKVLVPIIWDWAKRTGPKIQSKSDRYIFCWNWWRKVARKGIKAKRPLSRTVHAMTGFDHLYHFTSSLKGSEVKPWL